MIFISTQIQKKTSPEAWLFYIYKIDLKFNILLLDIIIRIKVIISKFIKF